MTKGELAYNNFLKGYNCTQSITAAFAQELDLDEKTAVRLSGGFGGGVGRLREICGTFSGIVIVVSALYGYSEPKDFDGKKALYERIQYLAEKFREENGSIVCRELLGLEKAEGSAIPQERTPEYYKKRPCPELCSFAGDLLERYITENPPKNKVFQTN